MSILPRQAPHVWRDGSGIPWQWAGRCLGRTDPIQHTGMQPLEQEQPLRASVTLASALLSPWFSIVYVST